MAENIDPQLRQVIDELRSCCIQLRKELDIANKKIIEFGGKPVDSMVVKNDSNSDMDFDDSGEEFPRLNSPIRRQKKRGKTGASSSEGENPPKKSLGNSPSKKITNTNFSSQQQPSSCSTVDEANPLSANLDNNTSPNNKMTINNNNNNLINNSPNNNNNNNINDDNIRNNIPINDGHKNKVGRTKLPPVIAYNVNPKTLKQSLSSSLGHTNFTFKMINANSTQILLNDKVSFNKTKEILSSQKSNFYLPFTPTDEKSKIILLKKVPHYYDLDDVTEALQTTFPTISFTKISKFIPPARYVKSSPQKYKNVNIWQIQVAPNTDISPIKSTTLLRCIQQTVKFELYNSHDIPQCKRCQRYGHVARNCNMKPRCVRCGNDHDIGSCQLPKMAVDPATNQQLENTIPTCCNCGQKGHPANFRCSKYKEFVQRVNEKKAQQVALQASKKKSFQNFVKTGVSFADMAKNQPTQKTSPIPIPKTVSNTSKIHPTPIPIDTSFYQSFSEIFQMAQSLKPVFQQIQNPFEQKAFLLFHLMSLDNGSRR